MKEYVLTILVVMMAMCSYGQSAIDVYSHIVTQEYLESLARHEALLDEGFPILEWNAQEYLKVMDAASIGVSALTMPAPQPWWSDVTEAKEIVRKVNEASAEVQKQYPERFRFVAALPLEDVDAAIEETRYAMDELGIGHNDGVLKIVTAFLEFVSYLAHQ